MKAPARYTLVGIVLAGIVIGFGYYIHYNSLYPSTDDAYVQANTVNIAPRVSGQVQKTWIHDNMYVKKGQALFAIDPKPYQIAVEKATSSLDNTGQQVRALMASINSAKAALSERKAELTVAKQNYQRIIALVKKGSESKSQGDSVTSKLHVAQANVSAAQSALKEAQEKLGDVGKNNAQVQIAKAALDQAKLNLSYTKITAPADGYISNYSLRIGDQVNANQSYFALVESGYWWAQANYKETNLDRIRPGQKASISIDMYPGKVFQGTVASISRGSGTSFALLPPENATGNWVKVTQRFPVRVTISSRFKNYPLRLGASCTVKINTTSGS